MVASLVAGALVGGVMVFGPERDEASPPAGGAAARAMLAASVGAPASLSELSTLIGEQEKWLRRHPGDDYSWAVLGSAYVARGTMAGDSSYFPKAHKALQRSLTALPGNQGNVDAQLGMAALANAKRDYRAAKRWGESVRARAPKRWTAYPVLIDAYNGLGEYPAARKAVEKLVALRPSAAPALARRAQAYRDRGRPEDAAAMAYDAMTHSGSPAEKAMSLHRLGELAWERGEPTEAVGYYDTALKIDTGHHPSLAGRARALAALGRKDEAFRDYQDALEKLPLAEYALEAGELYESMGLDGDAHTQYANVRRFAREARKNGVSEELTLARYEADHGNAKAAVARLGQEWKRGHRSVYVSDALGWALYRAGRAEEGLKYAKRAAAALDMRNALFLYHRGEIERSLGQDGPARRHLAAALRVNPYFSPLLVAPAKRTLAALGEPAPGGPADVEGEPWTETERSEGEESTESGESGESGEEASQEGESTEGESTEEASQEGEASEASEAPEASQSPVASESSESSESESSPTPSAPSAPDPSQS
ncbi:tetratricopeptide repeat protein [Streptomyces sp. NPDC054841]